ncbi:MAG: prephenate dehydratase [Nitrosomonadales bacterium]|nr:prephenate dehydratase [Nitrosomonadales bacterium]
MSDTLKKFREQIDRIDDELLRLCNERAKLAQQIGHLKEDGVVLRPEREAQVLRRLQENNGGPLSNAAVAQLFTEVMSQCRALEAPISVAFLGPIGTYSEEAVIKRFGHAINGFATTSIDEVFRFVESGSANYGIVPVENSSEGAVGRTLDLLPTSQLKICGEILLPIHHCLLVQPGELIEGRIREIVAHPQALAQCQNWLNINFPHVARIPVASNAEGARLAAGDASKAAIAGEQAAALFGLQIWAHSIEDDPRNTTRFLVIGNQEVGASGRDKTSLVMAATNRPGAVHDLLTPFAKNGVSLTKLESRPSRAGLWEYVFYVDIEGHQTDAKVAAALAELKQSAAFVKILGSYPVAV